MKYRSLALLGTLVMGVLFFSQYTPARAASTWSLVGSSSLTGAINAAMPVTGLQITGGVGSDVIPVKLRVTSGTLAMSTTTGLTFTGPSTGSTIYFEGTRTNINNALATLTYTRASTGTDTLEVSLVRSGEVFFPDNGHLYKFITSTLTWTQAKVAAEALEEYGAGGYLATITSSGENEFVSARLIADGWFGASDSGSEGVWTGVRDVEGVVTTPRKAGAFSWTLDENDRVSGTTDCNSWFGQVQIGSDGVISFGSIGSTKMFCMGDTQEDEFLSLLDTVRGYALIDDTHMSLTLRDGQVMLFEAKQ